MKYYLVYIERSMGFTKTLLYNIGDNYDIK